MKVRYSVISIPYLSKKVPELVLGVPGWPLVDVVVIPVIVMFQIKVKNYLN